MHGDREHSDLSQTHAGHVIAVACDALHRFGKTPRDAITLFAGLGVDGDAHAGVTVQHRSRVTQDPTQPNLRQLHLIEEERFDTLAVDGFTGIAPGAIGENIRTRGLALSALPTGTRLIFASGAEVVLTGLRNPCRQLDAFRPGLMRALIGRDAAGGLELKGGVMGVVARGGAVRAGDTLRAVLPGGEHTALRRV